MGKEDKKRREMPYPFKNDAQETGWESKRYRWLVMENFEMWLALEKSLKKIEGAWGRPFMQVVSYLLQPDTQKNVY